MTISHTGHLRGILFALRVLYDVFCFDGHVAAEVFQVSIAGLHVDANFRASVFQLAQFATNIVVGLEFNILTSQIYRDVLHPSLIGEESQSTFLLSNLSWVEKGV